MLRGQSCSQIMQNVLGDLVCICDVALLHDNSMSLQHLLRTPNSKNLHKKSDLRPFEVA